MILFLFFLFRREDESTPMSVQDGSKLLHFRPKGDHLFGLWASERVVFFSEYQFGPMGRSVPSAGQAVFRLARMFPNPATWAADIWRTVFRARLMYLAFRVPTSPICNFPIRKPPGHGHLPFGLSNPLTTQSCAPRSRGFWTASCARAMRRSLQKKMCGGLQGCRWQANARSRRLASFFHGFEHKNALISNPIHPFIFRTNM